MSSVSTSEERELSLVLKLELRLGNADSDEKLQSLLHVYLAPLILKLASEHASVRNKVIGACQYINRRLKSSPAVLLPLTALLNQFREAQNSFVRQFDLVYIQQGLERISTAEAVTVLPEVLKAGIPSGPFKPLSSEAKTWSVTFHFLLNLLRAWNVPDHISKESVALRDKLSLSASQANVLSYWLSRFLLYDGRSFPDSGNVLVDGDAQLGNNHTNTLSPQEYAFIANYDSDQPTRFPTADLQHIKSSAAKLLFTHVFSDEQRFSAAVILTSDISSLECFRIGDTMFKQSNFDLESASAVDCLLSLYSGNRMRIQIRVLSLLAKSREATKRTTALVDMIDNQLKQSDESLEASKVRSMLFAFITWTIRMGRREDLEDIKSRVLQAMREFIELQGWPSPSYALGEGATLSPAQLDMRKQAYSCIGSLAARFKAELDLLKFLFTSLRCDSSHREVHEAVNEALGQAINHFNTSNEESLKSLKDLLFLNMSAQIGTEDHIDGYLTSYNTRYASVKCANKCFPFHDIDARIVNLLAIASRPAGSEDIPQVTEEGTRGLDLYLHRSVQMTPLDTKLSILDLPNFDSIVKKLFGQWSIPETKLVLNWPSETRVTEPVLISIPPVILFCRNMLLLQGLYRAGKAPDIGPDWKQQLDAVIVNDDAARRDIRQFLRTCETTSTVRFLQSAIYAFDNKNAEHAEALKELLSLAPNELLLEVSPREMTALSQKTLEFGDLQLQLAAARCYGILTSLSEYRSFREDILAGLRSASRWPDAIGQNLIRVRGSLLIVTFGISRRYLRKGAEMSSNEVQEAFALTTSILTHSRDEMLKTASRICLSQLCLCIPDGTKFDFKAESILENLFKEAKREKEQAIAAIGRVIRFVSKWVDRNWISDQLENLYAFHEIRKPELQFAIGETLAVAATGWISTSLIAEMDVETSGLADTANPDVLAVILDRCIEYCRNTKPSLRKAASIWLLCLIQYCGGENPVREKLRQCQAAFTKLLADRDEMVQETASRGLGLVYEFGDNSVRNELVRDLVQSFTTSSMKMGGTVDEDTELFETGALPTGGGGSVTTYKDIVNLANEVGDPSLVYRFMNLASNNAIWSSRAAFGRFGLSSVLADSDYLSKNKKFYPKLFRYRFDPNPNVQRSMNDIWKALVKNPSAVIEDNFELIMEDLLKSIVGKEWRVREASCAAIADLIQDRDIERYEKYLGDIWKVSFKVSDDIKETVRIAAFSLCRTLVNLLIRNLEVDDGTTKRAGVMLGHGLEFLLQQLREAPTKEVQTSSAASLLEIVQKCPLRALRPYAPVLLENFIFSLSSMEHEAINYLHLNAEKYGLTSDKLDSMRVSGVNASPVTECIDRCLESLGASGEIGSQSDLVKDAMKRLEKAFNESIGLPSKVGLSRVMVTLTVRHSTLFRPFVDRFVQLTRKNVLDRNTTVSISFATSLAYLMRLASDKQIIETGKYVQNLYFESEQASNRSLAGEVIQAIAKVSNDMFVRFATVFMPLVFVGRCDTEVETRERFETTWRENVGGSRSVSLYFDEIIDLIQHNLKSPRWPIKHACCLATAELVKLVDPHEQYSQAHAERLWPVLEEALAGKTWPGKEKVVTAYPDFVIKSKSWRSDGQLSKQMLMIALREAKRKNMDYQPYAILALGQVVKVRNDLDRSEEDSILSYLKQVVEEITTADSGRMDTDDEPSG